MSTTFAGLNMANNYSFYAIPAAWFLAIGPHFYAMMLYNKERAPGTQEWDNGNPRANDRNIKQTKLSPFMEDRYLRAEAAQQNQFQNLPLFAAAIVAGNIARVPIKTLNTVAGLYLVFRFAYNIVYINTTSKFWGNVRSCLYLGGVISCMSLFVRAGNALW